MRLTRRGFTLTEIMIVVIMIGLLVSIAAPRLRVRDATKVRLAARRLAGAIETTRARALTTVSPVRIAFNTGSRQYTGFRDHDRNGAILEAQIEIDSLRAFVPTTLEEGVQYGRGGAPAVPGFAGAGATTLPGDRLNFDSRGLTVPFGTRGVIYLTSPTDPQAVAAISITPASAVRVWTYVQGAWR